LIRIKELYRLQNLKNLRLIAGQEGLERTVTAAVMLEYDPSRMQLPDFYRGDLVVTTLAYARGEEQLVAHSLLALMNQGVAGLLIKTAYFTELPREVLAQAERLGTPIFFFDDCTDLNLVFECGSQNLDGNSQQLLRVEDQVGIDRKTVTAFLRLGLQRVKDTRTRPDLAVARNADRKRNRVRGLESDSPNIGA